MLERVKSLQFIGKNVQNAKKIKFKGFLIFLPTLSVYYEKETNIKFRTSF